MNQREALLKFMMSGRANSDVVAALGVDTVHDLMSDGLIKSTFSSDSGWGFILTELGEEALK